jgi:hypothetical protein
MKTVLLETFRPSLSVFNQQNKEPGTVCELLDGRNRAVCGPSLLTISFMESNQTINKFSGFLSNLRQDHIPHGVCKSDELIGQSIQA